MLVKICILDRLQPFDGFLKTKIQFVHQTGGGGLTQKCRTCMGVGGCFRDPKHKSNMYTFVQQRGVSIFYPESQKYKWYFCTHIS